MKPFEAENWILQRGTHNGPYSLDKIEYLLDELKKPQLDYACILIGGTNGKGSVTSITETILLHCEDYQVGSYTSPHLLNLKERIKLQGKCISDSMLCEGVAKIEEICQLMDKEPSIGSPAFFEVMTALGFWSLREGDTDVALVEVGLGGRFDATNACSPEISVITNIGTDHQQFLGDTKIKIANEKLGIIRKNHPLLTTERDPEILAEFERVCKEKKAKLVVVEQNNGFEVVESKKDGHLIKLKISDEPIFFPMPGAHQLENLSLVLAIIEQMKKNGFQIPDEAIIEGIKSAHWAGRLQWIPGEPEMLLDGAHNNEGLDSLIKYLAEFQSKEPMNIIFGALKDKPMADMAKRLESYGHQLYFVPPICPRSPSKEEFANSGISDRWQWRDSYKQALEECKQDKSHKILVCGSLYLISEALSVIEGK